MNKALVSTVVLAAFIALGFITLERSRHQATPLKKEQPMMAAIAHLHKEQPMFAGADGALYIVSSDLAKNGYTPGTNLLKLSFRNGQVTEEAHHIPIDNSLQPTSGEYDDIAFVGYPSFSHGSLFVKFLLKSSIDGGKCLLGEVPLENLDSVIPLRAFSQIFFNVERADPKHIFYYYEEPWSSAFPALHMVTGVADSIVSKNWASQYFATQKDGGICLSFHDNSAVNQVGKNASIFHRSSSGILLDTGLKGSYLSINPGETKLVYLKVLQNPERYETHLYDFKTHRDRRVRTTNPLPQLAWSGDERALLSIDHSYSVKGMTTTTVIRRDSIAGNRELPATVLTRKGTYTYENQTGLEPYFTYIASPSRDLVILQSQTGSKNKQHDVYFLVVNIKTGKSTEIFEFHSSDWFENGLASAAWAGSDENRNP